MLSPADALLRLRAAGLPGIALLESLGPVLPYARFTFLSAAPTCVQHTLPELPAPDAFFPAWLGGLKYEAAREFGLAAHPASGPAQWWGFYPSGLVWDREAGTLSVVGEPHLDWAALLASDPAPLPSLTVGDFGADDVDYPAGVRAVQELIRAGEVYQVNLSRGVSAPAQGDPLAAYLRLREVNPSPFMAFLDMGNEVVVSCSPERLVDWAVSEGGGISARPIAGTRRRGDTPEEDAAFEAELRASPKEVAEHTMLVDLVRHDLGAVAAPGTVSVPDLMLVERYSHVMHLVSEVTATARAGLTLPDLLAATFPGGTITGAPKARVMDAIAALEPGPRGWYTGGAGLVSGRRVDVNILIRTAEFVLDTAAGSPATPPRWTVTVRAGGGTVIDADPAREARETVHKAQALLSVLAGVPGRPAQAGQPPVPGRPWTPPPVPKQAQTPLRVLVLDNRDSFTWNLAHDLLALGAMVDVRSQDEDAETLLASRPDAVLVGPGPGTPQTSGCTLALTRRCLERGVPLLGVCLGHQALGEVLGGRVERAEPVHGRPERVQHGGAGLFAGIENGAAFGRYHSLVVRGLPDELVTARSEGGEIMALAVPGKPAWGVQFHPESVLSPAGRVLLGNWLRAVAGSAALRGEG
ncbi:aminodeoxychorismate components I/II [Deinococcus radiodurans]|uniref:Anthranilate synthase component I n=1 Tax=Deinococcus radiodurans (strain ATCC 13939 / DSM 20539 / JCM 16871 / CCUG 27074 / LMG 4051 / NBRC 15346 / NCIMB 9279 / VKM B-1422 / R1) TaxID=243230 RepID=Q9RXV9_DEIRA|nr:aminodeoxychorismate components I/II [Deinococcus radiodurans]AAF09783.1 anthranilate synthase component I [Deinococcus radiodurans R1 = ATCC 13939 = DSM 20539]ANC72530.1 anthranilate synthase [Deinococcus radiodurans R1 = ATCC 13939 = DSM 20539]QEM72161.1 aminodeoxychorismate components I/II [Deinococcus radiodurans]QIP28423.1 aminodeoxychorismate components I/II [Deinococcus radiodurans]QIP32858.1 aminodeoxychorismate components I/II [Deinococcus radiodurans]